MKDTRCGLPNDAYIFRMTDDTGMFQHAKYTVPDPSEGYTTDDNARALIMAVLFFETTGKQKYLDLIVRYLSFLLYAQSNAWFSNFMDYDRHFTEEKGSQDCFGRCMWALGFTASRPALPAGVRETVEFLLRQAVPGCHELTFLRSKAYTMIGLHYWKSAQSRVLLTKFASDLGAAYEYSAETGWKWFEDELTYCNAVLPWAMLDAHETTEEKRYLEIGLKSLDFLLSVTFANGTFRPVGCKGWFHKRQSAAEFDQQPVEACETLFACLKAYKLTGNEIYLDRAKQCLGWYTGRNSLGVSLIDPDTGGCMDGLTPSGPNRNEGAESLVSWAISSIVWAKRSIEKEVKTVNTKIHDTIFRENGIRGIYDEDLTADEAELLGMAFGTYIRQKGETKAIVGMDNRISSPDLIRGVIRGLRSTGIEAVNIGTVVTPIFYYSAVDFGISAGIMVTASHDPAQYNGFKMQYDGRALYGSEFQQIKELMKKGPFEHGSGAYSFRSPVEDYNSMINGKIHLGNRKLKVVVDAGNGSAGLFAPQILKALGCEVIPLYCDSNPSFPHHPPDPTRAENMQDLIKTVREKDADLGLGFDGDGDRLGVVDETGNIIWGDRMMVLFWREILPRHPGADAIVEVKCSDQLINEIKKLGGKPMFCKTGHSLIKAKMKEMNAVFTGEMSGYMSFADEYYGYDDAIYAAARLLRILSNTPESLHSLLSDLPKFYATTEIRVECRESEKATYVKKAKVELQKFALDTIEVDGIRARFNDGWGLVRASNTGPELIVQCEGKDRESCERIRKVIVRTLYPLKIVA